MVSGVTISDLILAPIYLFIIFMIAKRIVANRIEAEPCYKYFIPGLFAKMFGGIGVCLIYMYWYGGGDTIAYFHDVKVMAELLYTDPASLFYFTTQESFSWIDWSLITLNLGDYPIYSRDEHAWFVVRCSWFFALPAFSSFLATVILLNIITFIPVWKLYKVFIREFPNLQREFAITVFFIPSVAFWGSGLLKDNITFSAVCLYSHAFYSILILKRGYLIHILQIYFSYYILTSIKPYIFFALLPGSILWMASIGLNKFDNRLVRNVTAPALLVLAGLAGYFVLSQMGDKLGGLNVDTVLEKAVATQQDLKMDYYGGNSFDIGDFEATPTSMLSKAHLAISAALFRPFLWEARNPVMLISAVENSILLIFSIYILFKVRVIYILRLMMRHHLLLFSLAFSLFFSFGVGLSTSNFGSMVRYKIPAMPFFLASLIIAREIILKEKAAKEDKPQPEYNPALT
ncbi:MAG TPA: hypothetical protein VI757_10845 [Bacteroidia bacterium]|nr:hypothetical protein [Bacteroidia bacterium]